MKHATKIGLIAAAALVLLGGIVFAGVMAANHWDFAALGTPIANGTETRTVDVGEGFENISVRSDTADISFLPSEDGSCKVVFCMPSDVQTAAAVRGGTLTVEVSEEKVKIGKWYEHISLFTVGSSGITVYLPQAEYAALVIEEHTGDIILPEAFTFESIDIKASTGDIDCRASASGQVRIRTGTGRIRAEGVSVGALDCTVTSGTAELRSVACAGDLGIAVSTGKAFLTDVSCRNLVSGGSTGNLTLENVTAAELISIERSTGDVNLTQCDAKELSIRTDTGDVTGSLRSEKVFLTQTDTGRVSVPGTTTGGVCRITTDTGDIKISIG